MPGSADLRKRSLINVVQADDKAIVGIDLPELLRNLLLFENVTIRSGRILDLGYLVRILGLDDALAVVRATGFKIHCDPSTLARAGEPRVRTVAGGGLRLERLDYGIVGSGDHSRWIDSGFREAIGIAGLTAGRAKKFENVVRGRLLPVDPHSRVAALEEAKRDLLSVSLSTRAALDVALHKACGVGLPPLGSYRLDVRLQEGVGYVAETDLPGVIDRSPEIVASAVNEGLLGAVGINTVLDDIRVHEAMVGMEVADLAVLNEKLVSFARQFDGAVQAERLTRVQSTLSVYRILQTKNVLQRVDVRRLLEVRESDECRAFRDWLWASDSVTDAEIQDRFASVRARLGSVIRTGPGKGVRWAVGTGLGAIPVVGTVAGAVAGIFDTFMLERMLPTRGPLSFLGDQYKSIFKGR